LWIGMRTSWCLAIPAVEGPIFCMGLDKSLCGRVGGCYLVHAVFWYRIYWLRKRSCVFPRSSKSYPDTMHYTLIIDDIEYVQQNREEMEVLFTLFTERYERGSVMLSSNLPFSKWEQIFKDPMVTAATIDRLVHHGVIIELNLESYRMEHALKSQKSK